jgi:hypothetical protein
MKHLRIGVCKSGVPMLKAVVFMEPRNRELKSEIGRPQKHLNLLPRSNFLSVLLAELTKSASRTNIEIASISLFLRNSTLNAWKLPEPQS